MVQSKHYVSRVRFRPQAVLSSAFGGSQVVVATGSKWVFVSGQQPEDLHGKLVGHGDFAAQARLAFGNLGGALAAAGARPEQVCKITIYVVDYKRDEHVPIIEAAQIELFGDHKPANVVVGVAMMSPGYLIEVDAIAVIDQATESYERTP